MRMRPYDAVTPTIPLETTFAAISNANPDSR